MRGTETVYLGRNNTINLVLKADGVPVDLTSVSSIKLTIGATIVTSTNQPSDAIRWNQGGYVTGELRMALGAQNVVPGTYSAELIVYDATNPLGVDWGKVVLTFMDDPLT